MGWWPGARWPGRSPSHLRRRPGLSLPVGVIQLCRGGSRHGACQVVGLGSGYSQIQVRAGHRPPRRVQVGPGDGPELVSVETQLILVLVWAQPERRVKASARRLAACSRTVGLWILLAAPPGSRSSGSPEVPTPPRRPSGYCRRPWRRDPWARTQPASATPSRAPCRWS